MKPYLHSLISVKKWKGNIDDYQKIHDFIDSSKAHYPKVSHRAILHNSFGIYICEQVFGVYIKNSSDLIVQVRDIAEQHILDDLGTIPTVQDYLQNMEIKKWMGGKVKKRIQTIKLVD